MDDSRTLLDSEAPPGLVFGDRAVSVHCEALLFAVVVVVFFIFFYFF